MHFEVKFDIYHLRYAFIVQDDLETFGDIGSLEDNVESFLSNDGGDGNIYGAMKQTITEHKPESSKGGNASLTCIHAFFVVFVASSLRG